MIREITSGLVSIDIHWDYHQLCPNISTKSAKSFLNEKYGSQLKKFDYFDIDIEPYKRQEIQAIIKDNLEMRAAAKARSPIFQHSDPICQGVLNTNQTEVKIAKNYKKKKYF